MRTVNIKASREYNVVIGAGLLAKAGSLITEVAPKATKALLVSETNVAPLYAATVKASLEEAGLQVFEYTFAAGEQSKNINSITGMWGVMATNAFTRTDIVVSLGGGVAGDMSGFAAATFLRGIQVAQIPTSLLAMVDACVGGKTGIDLPEGKNQVGAFHQPSIVIEDTECLKTLSDETFTEGLGEVLKYAFIMDKELYSLLRDTADQGKALNLRNEAELLEDIVGKCVADKAYTIMNDEFDNGIRQTLNFGHTAGHVIEKDSNFTLAHGLCVAKGMGLFITACKELGMCESEEADKMLNLMKAYNLPTEDNSTPESIVKGAMNDKKKRGNTLSIILVNKIGEAEIVKVTPEEFLKFLKKETAPKC